MSYTEAFTHKRFYTQMLLHTLAQKHLCELLVWNASHVQKHFSKTWQDRFERLDMRKCMKEIFLRPCSKVHQVLMQLFQIAKTAQALKIGNTELDSLFNSSNWVLQVQVVDQTTHPPKYHSFVGLDRQIGSSPPALKWIWIWKLHLKASRCGITKT